MTIISFIISVVALGAFAAVLTNGLMEGLKQLPFIDKLPSAVKFIIMLAVGAACAYIVQDGAKDYISTHFWLMWLSTIAAAQLGYDKIIKQKIEKLGGDNADTKLNQSTTK